MNTAKLPALDSKVFNAQTYAHALLRLVSTGADPLVAPGVRSPNKLAAKSALLAEAAAAGLPRTHQRVELVCRWIDMSSGVGFIPR